MSWQWLTRPRCLSVRYRIIVELETESSSETSVSIYCPAMRYFPEFVGIMISRWDGESGVQIPAEVRDIFLVQNIKTSSRAHTASSSVGNRLLSLEQSDRDMKLNNHHSLMSILQMTGDINPLHYMHSWCKEGEFYLLVVS